MRYLPVRPVMILGLAVLAVSSIYADITIEVSVQKNILKEGESTEMAIAIKANGADTIQNAPELPKIDGLNFVYVTQSSNRTFSMINGQTQNSIDVKLYYEVYAMKKGKYTVSGISLPSKAGQVQAQPIELTVFEGEPQKPAPNIESSAISGDSRYSVYVLSSTNKKECYTGEEIIASYSALFHQQWKQWIDYNATNNRGYVNFKDKSGELKDFLNEKINLRFTGQSQPVRPANTNDLFFQRPLINFILYPLKPGEYTFNPIEMEFMLQPNRRNPIPVPIAPQPLTLAVKPLPDAGKPDIFAGAVGKFTLESAVDSAGIEEGETVTLKVTLEGFGNLKNAPKPVLPDLTNFDRFDPTTDDDIVTTENGMRGRIIYSYVLMPHDINATQIGPVRYAYFDPNQVKYITLQTKPITLSIQPAKNGTLRSGSSFGVNRRIITRIGDDFRFIATGSAALSTVFLPIYKTSGFWFSIIIPVLLLIATLLWKRRQDFFAVNPVAAKSRKAPRLAKKFLADAGKALQNGDPDKVYPLLGKAITDYIDFRWNLSCAGMTSLELKENLTRIGLDEPFTDSIVQTLEIFDSARFSGTRLDGERMKQDYSETETLLHNMISPKIIGGKKMENSNGSMIAFGIVGSLIGGFVAFLARPSALLVGQLPFIDVISRGSTLNGLDQMLVPIAQRSFNITLAGAIIGAIAGIVIGYFVGKKNTAQSGT